MSPPPLPPPPPIPTSLCSLLSPPDLILAALSLIVLLSSPSRPHLRRFPTNRSNPRPPSLSLKNPFPTFSITAMQKPSPLRFSSPKSLSDWLRPRLPNDSLSSWGVAPGTKNVHNLWLELSEGETSLADSSPPIRTVHVATVRIVDASARRVLIESHQELSDGSIRPRNRPLSEKMKPHETIEEAVCRAVREELGSLLRNVDEETVRILPGSYVRKVEERASASYPGLPACYVLHSVDAWVGGLPDEEFCSEEIEEYGNSGEAEAVEKAVSVKRHFWKWVDTSSDDCI